MNKEKYILEYWIDSSAFTKESLEQKLSKELNKLEVDIKIEKERDYNVLRITSDSKNIDACHHHLSFYREEAFRAKDELGDELRLKAYPVLAEIETRLRRFITRAMIEVLGFNWWDSSTPPKIRKNVSEVEKKSGSKQAEDHHQIEFTMFDDLIAFVTGKYQKWPDTKNITPTDLSAVLNGCKSIEELKQKVNQKRKQTSLWKEVFSNYFADKKAWEELRNEIREVVIPVRNKVMHHRLMRLHELRQLKECRNEVSNIISTAKSELSSGDFEQARQNIKAAFESIRFQLDPNIIKALSQPIIDPEVMKRLQRPIIDPSIIKAMYKPLIDPEMLRGIMPRFNFGMQGLNDEYDSGEDNEKKLNGGEESGPNDEEDNSDDDTNEKD